MVYDGEKLCTTGNLDVGTQPVNASGVIQNTACQPNVSVSQPPRTGPAAVVNAEAAAHTPIARLRSSLG